MLLAHFTETWNIKTSHNLYWKRNFQHRKAKNRTSSQTYCYHKSSIYTFWDWTSNVVKISPVHGHQPSIRILQVNSEGGAGMSLPSLTLSPHTTHQPAIRILQVNSEGGAGMRLPSQTLSPHTTQQHKLTLNSFFLCKPHPFNFPVFKNVVK